MSDITETILIKQIKELEDRRDLYIEEMGGLPAIRWYEKDELLSKAADSQCKIESIKTLLHAIRYPN